MIPYFSLFSALRVTLFTGILCTQIELKDGISIGPELQIMPPGDTVFTGAGGPPLIAPGRLTRPAMSRKQGYSTARIKPVSPKTNL